MRGVRVAVAGCGPCGLATALLLAERGHHVTLFERFTEPRSIGSGLMIQPTGLAVLRQLGLAERLRAEGARIDRLIGLAGARTVLDVRYAALNGPVRFGIGVHRASLFGALHEAVQAAGLEIRTGLTVTGTEQEGDKRRLTFEGGGRSERFDLVVDALGTRSPLAQRGGRELAYGALWATLDWPTGDSFDIAALQQRYRRSSVMAGVLPVGAGRGNLRKAAFFWSLRCDALEQWKSAGLGRWKSEVADLWPACQPFLDQIVDPGQLTFARYAHRTVKRPTAPALVHVGDAWHSASPQLGQGANMALLDAWALAKALREEEALETALRRTVALRRSHVRLYQALSALFTPAYQSDSRILPWIRDRIVPPFGRLWPATRIQAEMVAGTFGGPLERLGLRG